MTVTVIKPQEVETRPTFKRGELVISTNESYQNIYFVTGQGMRERNFAGVRVSGTGEFAEYNNEYLKDSVKLFTGELVIRND